MYFPLISKRQQNEKQLYRRKGGGGKGGGGGGKSGGGTSGAGRSAGAVSVAGTSKSASAYSRGGGAVTTIPAGSAFAGRTAGGGTRDGIYGTKSYGSGYPGVPSTARGTSGYGFPFFYYPIVFVPIGGYGGYHYVNHEYGDPNNSSRPGGPLGTLTYTASQANNTFRILADQESLQSLDQDISADCGSYIASKAGITAYTNDSTVPRPEQVVQYYRASSVSLSLDNYNNSAVYSNSPVDDSPIPPTTNLEFLNCLNTTIGAAVPLVDAGMKWSAPSSVGLAGLAYVVWCLTGSL